MKNTLIMKITLEIRLTIVNTLMAFLVIFKVNIHLFECETFKKKEVVMETYSKQTKLRQNSSPKFYL